MGWTLRRYLFYSLQISQLQRLRVSVDDARCLYQAIGGLKFTLGVNDLGPLFPFRRDEW